MFSSAELGMALDELCRCLSNLTFIPTRAPWRHGVPEGWEGETRHHVQQACGRAANMARELADRQAFEQGRIQVLQPTLEGQIGRARRSAMSLITLLASRPDLAAVYCDEWPLSSDRQEVVGLIELHRAFDAEARRLMAAEPPMAAAPVASPPIEASPVTGGQSCAVAEPEPPPAGVPLALLDESILAIHQAAREPGRSADWRMRQVYRIDRSVRGWSSNRWAQVLGDVTASAVRQTAFWEEMRAMRDDD